jgi:hypothetical protein
MAKSALACKARRTQKVFRFSESEMDVARQLIQLSGESDDHHHHRDDDDNNNNSCGEGKAEQSKVGDASSTNYTIGETFEEDGICWPRKRRFRSIYHLYSSTKPVIVANAKRMKRAV